MTETSGAPTVAYDGMSYPLQVRSEKHYLLILTHERIFLKQTSLLFISDHQFGYDNSYTIVININTLCTVRLILQRPCLHVADVIMSFL